MPAYPALDLLRKVGIWQDDTTGTAAGLAVPVPAPAAFTSLFREKEERLRMLVTLRELTGQAEQWDGTPESLERIMTLAGDRFLGIDKGSTANGWQCPGPTCLYQRDRFAPGPGAVLLRNSRKRDIHLPHHWYAFVEDHSGEIMVLGPVAWEFRT